MRVAVGGKNLEDIAFGRGNELKDRNVEGAAAEIVDRDFPTLRFVQSVSERGGGGLVDQAKDFEATDFAGVLDGLARGVDEIGRDSDAGAISGILALRFGASF